MGYKGFYIGYGSGLLVAAILFLALLIYVDWNKIADDLQSIKFYS
jgi:Na+-driven multidrug efflux pump